MPDDSEHQRSNLTAMNSPHPIAPSRSPVTVRTRSKDAVADWMELVALEDVGDVDPPLSAAEGIASGLLIATLFWEALGFVGWYLL